MSDIENVVRTYNIQMPVSSAYVIMNMLYSDMSDAFGDGDSEESLNRYINASKDWYYDKDAKCSEESKLFMYYMNIVK